jgi:hypothetical protein
MPRRGLIAKLGQQQAHVRPGDDEPCLGHERNRSISPIDRHGQFERPKASAPAGRTFRASAAASQPLFGITDALTIPMEPAAGGGEQQSKKVARISRRLVEDARARIEEGCQRLDRVRNRLQIVRLRRALQDRQQPREREEIGERIPTLTLSSETLTALGVRREHLVPTFTPEGRRLLEALLTSCGFNMARAVRVVELASNEGFVFTQPESAMN